MTKTKVYLTGDATEEQVKELEEMFEITKSPHLKIVKRLK